MLQTLPRGEAASTLAGREGLDLAIAGIVAGVAPREATPSQIPELDAWLPLGGFPKGALTEIVTTAGATAGHVGSLALSHTLLPLIAELTQAGKRVALIDYAKNIYPPALRGVVLENLLLIRPTRRSDALWAMQQCSRSPALALTLGAIPRMDARQARTLGLASEAGGGVCVAIRMRGEGSAGAALRLAVRAEAAENWHAAQLRVELLRSKPAAQRAPLLLSRVVEKHWGDGDATADYAVGVAV